MTEAVPDVYADFCEISTNLWGATLLFSQSVQPPEIEVEKGQSRQKAELKAVVRLSVLHAKVLTMLLKRNIRSWEAANGPLSISAEALNQMGLSWEDW